jgi:hypothetical protein
MRRVKPRLLSAASLPDAAPHPPFGHPLPERGRACELEFFVVLPAIEKGRSKPERVRSRYPFRLVSLVVLVFLLCGLVRAQDSAGTQPTPDQQEPSPTKVLGMESTGTVDLGYRWTAGFSGSEDLYRSLVNLGEGPRLLGANLNFANPLGANKYLDRLQLNASSWGGDPYNTLRLYAEKTGVYQFSVDYRNVNYFNFIPSFANPLLSQGVLLGQHSFDSTRRTTDLELTLRPGKTVSPFFGYSRNSGFGPGITTFTADGNEFAINNQLRDTSDYYRGGVTFNFRKLNLVLEQGYLTFKDDQRIFQTDGTNTGNRTSPLLGEDILLNQLDENYHVRGRTPVSRAQLTATPWENLTVSGRFVYSQPDSDFDYDRRSVGNFLSFDVLRAFTGELASGSAEADRPHILGNLAIEFRPTQRIRILELVLTDRFHIASSSSLGRSLTGTRPLVEPPDPNDTFDTSAAESNRLAVNLNQNQIEGVVDLTSRLFVRGGYRYVWSDTRLQSTVDEESVDQSVSLHRNVGIAGFGFRLPKKANLSLDFEAGQGDRVYSRTDILDYRRVRLRGRYQPWSWAAVSGSFSLLDHENNRPDLGYDFENRGYSFSLSFTPAGGKHVSANLDYSRADLTSDILFIIPQLLTSDTSQYIEDSHFGNATLDFGIFRNIRLSMGYAILSTSGSRPLNYHQPHAAVVVPITRRIAWTTEWRYYDYNEKTFSFEDFHNHLITAGLRFSY